MLLCRLCGLYWYSYQAGFLDRLFLQLNHLRCYIYLFLLQCFFGENGSFSIYFTKEAMYNALLSTYQFVLIVAYSCMLTLTTSPSEIAKTLYIFIKPFKIFKVNVENTGLSMLIAVRFIPLIFEEASKIITAQKLRGLW